MARLQRSAVWKRAEDAQKELERTREQDREAEAEAAALEAAAAEARAQAEAQAEAARARIKKRKDEERAAHDAKIEARRSLAASGMAQRREEVVEKAKSVGAGGAPRG